MKSAGMSQLLARIIRAEEQQICPECGARMAEMNRLHEDIAVFVWYKCRKADCDGQWLAKIPRPSHEISSRKIRVMSNPTAAAI